MAITIYRNTDRIKLKIHDAVFLLKPLTYHEKTIVSGAITNSAGDQRENAIKGLSAIMKYSIRGVEGIKYLDGSSFVTDFDDAGNLKDSAIDELLNISITADLTTALYQFLQGIPDKVVDHDGKALDHIQITPIIGQAKKN